MVDGSRVSSTFYRRIGKRIFDLFLTIVLLPLILPLLALAWVAAWLSSGQASLFSQERTGKDLKPFLMLKLRTMRTSSDNATQNVFAITARGDQRVTSAGRFLRLWKLDELPQVLNVLRGEMSLVGPRPEVSEWVQRQLDQFASVLEVRPGITSLASVAFVNEEVVLAESQDPLEAYAFRILPRKIHLNQLYAANVSFALDLEVLMLTVLALFRPKQAIRRAEQLASELST